MGIELLAILGGFGLLGLLVMDLTLERQDTPWLFVCAIALAREVSDPLPSISAAGLAINGEDILLAVALLVVGGWVLRGISVQVPQLLLIGALGLAMFSVLRGGAVYGLPGAINEARETLYFIAGALLGSFVPVGAEARRRLMRGWLFLAASLTALAVLRWGIVFAGLPFTGPWYETEFGGLRVLSSNGTLVITIAFLTLLPRTLRGIATDLERLLVAGFGATVLLLQHRSVWIVFVLGTAFMVVEYRKQMSRGVIMGAGVAMVVVGLTALTYLNVSELSDSATEADAASDTTWEWRVSGWGDLLDHGPEGVLEWGIGVPYGAGWNRSVSAGFDVDVPPHNFYLEMVLRIGVLGIGFILVAGIESARRLRAHELDVDDGYFNAVTMQVILLSQALYSIPYNLGMEQGLLLGLAIAIWADPLRREGKGMHVVAPNPAIVRR